MTTLFVASTTILNAIALTMVKMDKAGISGIFALLFAFITVVGVISGELHGEALGFCIIATIEFLMATFLCRKNSN